MIKKYIKKPVEVEAVQWTGTNIDEIEKFAREHIYEHTTIAKIAISTQEGIMVANIGDYIIKGVNGEFYPCKPDIFKKTYEVE